VGRASAVSNPSTGVRASQERALLWEKAITTVFSEGTKEIMAMAQRSNVAYREDGDRIADLRRRFLRRSVAR
jgi:hypothetical protein